MSSKVSKKVVGMIIRNRKTIMKDGVMTVHVDPLMTSRLLGFLSQCVEMKGPMLVDQLFHAVASLRIPEDQWACMLKTPQDLSTFLKMHSDAFHVQSDLVTLVSVPPQTSPTRSCSKPSNQISTSLLSCSPLHQNNNNNNNNLNNVRATSRAGGASGDYAWKLKLFQSTKVIVTVKESLQIVEDILSQAATEKVAISFDCEGINLGLKGRLTLFQLGTSTGLAYIFDPVRCPDLVTAGGLEHLLESESVVKVLHDCRNDSVNLYNQFGITLRNVFDTQAAHAVLQLQELGTPVYNVENVSLNALCGMYNAPMNSMKSQLKKVYRRDQRYWARRPLTWDMILYAAGDVFPLVPHVYNAMIKLIKPEYEFLLKELCEEQVYMHIKPDDVKQRKKQRKVEKELADLRGKLAASTNESNIVLSNREIRLLRDGKGYEDCNEDSGNFPSLEHSGKTSPPSS